MHRALGRMLILSIATATFCGWPSLAQDAPPDPNLTGNAEEAPPPPEAPYPNAPDPDQPVAQQPKPSPSPQPSSRPVAKPQPKPQPQQQRASRRQYPREAPQAPAVDVLRPSRITSDGHYVYDNDVEPPSFSGTQGISAPERANKQGEFFYGGADTPEFSGRSGVERPVQIKKSGEFLYKTIPSKERSSASVRMGMMTPPKIENGAVRYVDVYGSSNVPVIFGDYEWRLVSSLGRFGIKFGSGLMVSSGAGRFKNAPPAGAPSRVTEVAEEKFTFVTFPNQLTAIYKFQYASNQIFVPFVEGGAGYFTFVEIRDDEKGPKFGGSAVSVAAGGVNFLMDWLDPKAVRQLDNEYGINHVWLTLEYRLIVGLNPKYDFSSNSINAGVLMDF